MPAPAINEFVHDLFNQLTVINLSSGRLTVSLGSNSDPVIATNLETLARAADEATTLAERLAPFMAESRPADPEQAAKSQNLQPQLSKVVRLL
ncbi:MAG TPA: hypothetical protein VMR20_03565 [Verrucomicrobiae bacterium]|nr:hypothetical protein [Verrucomicrobiae bacterium]